MSFTATNPPAAMAIKATSLRDYRVLQNYKVLNIIVPVAIVSWLDG